MICPLFGSISRPKRSRIGIVIELPQVGHWPSCAHCASWASRRLEQYGQLNPKRRPTPARPTALPPRRKGGATVPRVVEWTAPLTVVRVRIEATGFSGNGTLRVERQVGQRTNCPACDSSADSEVRQTLQGNTSMGRRE